VQDGKQWLRLELVPMDDGPDGIIAALAKWTADMKRVKQRAYIGGEIYHLRPNDKGDLVWYHQPDPAEGKQPAPRYEVTDAKLLARLAKNKGRGPFAPNTLRVRQVLVSATLGYAWRQLRWLEHDIASLIACEKLGPGREIDLSYDQVLAILIAAPVGFDEAMLGAAWIGWRRGNVLGMPKRRGRTEREGLTWARTVFPVWQENPETRERTLLQLGYVQTLRGETKNGDPLVQPMSERLEQLLRLRWDQRNGALVFHRGDGSPWHEYRRIWRSTLKRARQFVEIPVSFRWHDFRHIWATELTRAGATTRQLMELGGWRDEKMPKLYAHLDAKHLLDVVNAPARRNGG
jgi:integrase